MKSRLIASVALSATAITGLAGCSMLAPQATEIQYSPSDGVSVPDSGPLLVRNAMLVATDDGTSANFVAAIVNSSDEDQTLLFTIDGVAYEVEVDGGGVVSLGSTGTEAGEPILVSGLDSLPGSDVDVTFQSGEGTAATVAVPVIGGELPYYSDLVPTEEATPAAE